MKRLQAVKALTYATRRLLPGDTFHARTPRDEKVLLATRKVRECRDAADVPPPPPAVAERIAEQFPNMQALRAEYEKATGKRPFWQWNADKLRELIAAAKAGQSTTNTGI